MLPHKHYAAPEIEQVLNKHENPAAPPHECGAEESTLRRWICEFPEILTALASHRKSPDLLYVYHLESRISKASSIAL